MKLHPFLIFIGACLVSAIVVALFLAAVIHVCIDRLGLG